MVETLLAVEPLTVEAATGNALIQDAVRCIAIEAVTNAICNAARGLGIT